MSVSVLFIEKQFGSISSSKLVSSFYSPCTVVSETTPFGIKVEPRESFNKNFATLEANKTNILGLYVLMQMHRSSKKREKSINIYRKISCLISVSRFYLVNVNPNCYSIIIITK